MVPGEAHLPMDPKTTSIARLLQRHSEERPASPAILSPGRAALTYHGLWEEVQQVAGTLHEFGLGRGARIALILPEGPELAVAELAIASFGVAIPLSPSYRAVELNDYLAPLKAQAVLVQKGWDTQARLAAGELELPVLELVPDVEREAGRLTLRGKTGFVPVSHSGWADPQDTAFVLMTSGTTSKPKKIPLTHINLLSGASFKWTSLGISDVRMLSFYSLNHSAGIQNGLLTPLWGGGSSVCTAGFQADSFRAWLFEFQPTCCSGGPAVYLSILNRMKQDGPLVGHSLKVIRSGAAPLLVQTMSGLEQVFGVPVLEGYGLTETCGQMTSNPYPPGVRKAGSCGIPFGQEMRIVNAAGDPLPAGEAGEVVVRGDNVVQGYEGDSEATHQAFFGDWFRTGDLGYVDQDGYLFLTGRIKDMINRGGEKILPLEVEEVLLRHPGVQQAACFAARHAQLGEVPAAAVVLNSNAGVTESQLRQFAAESLADFKVPMRIHLISELPVNRAGKVLRRVLTEQYGALEPSRSDQEPAAWVEPRNDLERTLARAWTKLLGVSQVGVNDDLVGLGADSIVFGRAAYQLSRDFGVEIRVVELFDHPTVRGQAELITERLGQLSDKDAAEVAARLDEPEKG